RKRRMLHIKPVVRQLFVPLACGSGMLAGYRDAFTGKMNAKSFLVRLLTKPGYEIRKYAVQRWLQHCGIHVDIARYTKFSYDACNFRGVPDGKTAVIFDVGANIGQSSIWFSKSFPQASIYAFEPFTAVY